jgi:L-ribulose-5-phosphate 3-epimerase
VLKAITQLCFGGGSSVREVLEFSKSAGYEGLELVMSVDGDLNLNATQADYDRLSALSDELGMAYTSICAGGGVAPGASLTADDPAARRAAHDGFAKSLEACEALGIGAVLCVPGSVSPEIRYDVALERAREGVRKLAPVAEAHKVKLCIENVWNKMLLSPTEMRDFVDSIESPYVAAFLDVGNMLIWSFPEHWIEILGERIARVHFKDFRRSDYAFVQLMDGDVDWPRVMAALRGVGYDGPVISEVDGDADAQVETARRMGTIIGL